MLYSYYVGSAGISALFVNERCSESSAAAFNLVWGARSITALCTAEASSREVQEGTIGSTNHDHTLDRLHLTKNNFDGVFLNIDQEARLWFCVFQGKG